MLSDDTHSYLYRLTKRKMGKRPRSSRFIWIVVSILIALGLDVINGLITLPFKPVHHTHRGTTSSYSHMKIILIPRGGALLKEVYRRRDCALASSSSSGRIWNSEKNDGNVCRNPTNVDVEVALSRANNLRFACAKIAALSAIVDLLLEGKVILAGDSGRWWLSLTTLWKLSLSINVWHIARLFARIPQEQDVDKFTQGAEEILRTMTAVWRQTGIVVTLLILRKATMAWQDRIPFVRQILVTLVIGAVGATLYLSSKENPSLSLAVSEREKDNETPGQRIGRHGRVTLRTMALCSSAFLLQGALIGFVAISQTSWGAFWGQLSHIPTPIGLGTLLWSMRKAFGHVLSQLSGGSSTKMSVSSQARIELNEATAKFWAKAKTTMLLETALKIVVAAVSLAKSNFKP
jgi:hypothetical protein